MRSPGSSARPVAAQTPVDRGITNVDAVDIRPQSTTPAASAPADTPQRQVS